MLLLTSITSISPAPSTDLIRFSILSISPSISSMSFVAIIATRPNAIGSRETLSGFNFSVTFFSSWSMSVSPPAGIILKVTITCAMKNHLRTREITPLADIFVAQVLAGFTANYFFFSAIRTIEFYKIIFSRHICFTCDASFHQITLDY